MPPPVAFAPIDWPCLRAAVFDLDGTLYAHKPLHRTMLRELLVACFRRPATLREVRALRLYRQTRERLGEEAGLSLAAEQYRQPAARLGIPPEEMAALVETWMVQRPLAHLRAHRFSDLDRLFDELRARGVALAVFSDYPVTAKLAALGLRADVMVSADDPAVDRLKPDPSGLNHALAKLGVAPDRAILFGDRDDRDGECARRAGVVYRLKVEREPTKPLEFRFYRAILDGLTVPSRKVA